MRRICIFCGSSDGERGRHLEVARAMGRALAERGLELVYGGGRLGLMGALADGALDAGGRVTGVIPRALVARERAHQRVTELHEVGSMHERKAMMAELSDGFAALPGGMGTLEELAESLTWAQLGLHRKPCGVVNAGGFFDPLIAFFDRATAEGFIRPEHRVMLLVTESPEELLDAFAAYRPPEVPKWIDEAEM
ncbi:MAG TPA: TIGR00730 family Rossman fold protein [Thermoanaerobaculia bacterium]|nr:TIGR00730 family Rossman fold protein [Thermoanaerobaculia bacterium]